MQRKFYFVFLIMLFVLLLSPIKVNALTSSYVYMLDCEDTLLGSTSDENSVAWLVQQVLDFIKIVGPILVVVLSSVDFVQVILSGDDQAMSKAQKKLITRLILAACLFLLPFLVSFLLDLFGLTTDGVCALK